MRGKKKLMIAAVAAVVVLAVGAVCIWWFFPGDQRPVNMSAKELERYWPYASDLNRETAGDPQVYPDGVEVRVNWDSDGSIAAASIYDPRNDTYYEIYSATEGYKYTRFRNGPSGRTFYPPKR